MKKLFLSTFALLASLSIFGANDGRSFKRGFGDNSLYYVEDLEALKTGCTWYYNWGNEPEGAVQNFVGSTKGIEFIPQAWSSYDANKLRAYYKAHPEDRYLLGFNEPNFPDQAAMLPSEAAVKWHELEQLAKELNLILVGPAMNYAGKPLKDGKIWNPYDWMDAFIAAYKEKYGTEPHYDYTAVHAYMDQADAMMTIVDGFAKKYGKKVWLTEFCAWEDPNITAEAQQEYMIDKVKALETDDNVYRYAWFKARNANKYPYYNLLYYPTKKIAKGTLTALGFAYVHMSTFDKAKYYGLNEAIPANGFIDCYLTSIQQSADPRAKDITELNFSDNGLNVTYQVDVPEAGDYQLVVRYATEEDGNDPKISIHDEDGNILVKKQAIDATEGWNTYHAAIFDVTLKAGKQKIEIQKENAAGMALSLVKLVKTVDESDEDLKTLTGEPIVKPDPTDDGGDYNPNTPSENESFDKEVVVSDDEFKFADNTNYYSIFLDEATKNANIDNDNFINLGDNGTSQNSYLWEDSFKYGEVKGNNSFGETGAYMSIVTSDKGWSGMGYNINGKEGDVDLSGINNDYHLHMALRASHNYPIDFYLTDGSGHQAHLIFGQYDLDGKDPVANFKRDGKWHNVDIPMSYLNKKFGIDFSKDTDYDGNLLCISAGGKAGVEVAYDAIFFYGPEDSKPTPTVETGLSRFKATITDEPFKFSDDERYYVITLDATTKAYNLEESQIVDCGPNGTSHNLYPWDNTCAFNKVSDENSFGQSEPYMSCTQVGDWFGLGYSVAGSTEPLNLSGINDDYFLHFAVKSTYTGPILFTVTDAAGKSGNIVLGKETYHDHTPLGDFARDGKWHNVEVPVHLLNLNDGVNFTRSTNFTGNVFSILMNGVKNESTIDYDAVFFHGPKEAPAYTTEKVDNANFTITKAEDKPFQFSEDEAYYIITLDGDTKSENLDRDQIVDIGPNEQTRFLYPWGNTVTPVAAMGENSFGVEAGYTAWETVAGTTWSGLGFYIDRPGLTNLSGINKDYSLHFAIKSTTTQPIDVILADGNKKELHFVLGKEKYGDNAPVGDFERDGNWYNVDIPVAYLIKHGLDYRTATAYEGNVFSVMLGTTGGQKCDYDAVFFHGPKGESTGINQTTLPTQRGKASTTTAIFDLQGRQVQSMDAPGIYIIRTEAGVKKVIKK